MNHYTENVSTKRTLRRLLGYLRPHKKAFVLSLFILALGTAADVAGPKLVQIFIDDYLLPRNFDVRTLLVLGSAYLGLQVLAVVCTYVQLLNFQKIAYWVVQRIRVDVFSKLQHLALSFFDRTPGGSIISRVTNDTEAVKVLFVSVLSTFLQNSVLLIGILIGMFFLDVRLAVYCLALIPIIFAMMYAYRKFSSKIIHLSREKLSELNAKLNESLQGMHIIQAMRQERRFRRVFAQTAEEHYAAGIRQVKLSSLLVRPAVEMLYLLMLMLVVGFFGFKSLSGAVEIGVLYAFLNYLDRFFEPVNTMMFRLTEYQQAIVAAERVFGLIDEDAAEPVRQGDDQAKIRLGLIEFRNVSFSYDGKTDVLKNISFTAKPGQTVALVGATGSGKSSIINVLMRFYPVKEGEVLIDGIPLERFSAAELRANMGLVLQDPFLFSGDIKSNIRLADEMSDEEVRRAAEFVQADAFIRRLPGQYEAPVGERGAAFSAGQRQLIAFARTIARDPKILILDEATASIDTETEGMIMSALNNMRQGRTTIAVAHRLSTIQDADLILVLHQGEIVERGTHSELIAARGLYWRMYMLQHGEGREDSGNMEDQLSWSNTEN